MIVCDIRKSSHFRNANPQFYFDEFREETSIKANSQPLSTASRNILFNVKISGVVSVDGITSPSITILIVEINAQA